MGLRKPGAVQNYLVSLLEAYSTRDPFVPMCMVDASLSQYVGKF